MLERVVARFLDWMMGEPLPELADDFITFDAARACLRDGQEFDSVEVWRGKRQIVKFRRIDPVTRVTTRMPALSCRSIKSPRARTFRNPLPYR